MNRNQTERLQKRLDSLEQQRPEALPTVELCVVEPTPAGPRDTGEQWGPAPGGGFQQSRAATHATR